MSVYFCFIYFSMMQRNENPHRAVVLGGADVRSGYVTYACFSCFSSLRNEFRTRDNIVILAL